MAKQASKLSFLLAVWICCLQSSTQSYTSGGTFAGRADREQCGLPGNGRPLLHSGISLSKEELAQEHVLQTDCKEHRSTAASSTVLESFSSLVSHWAMAVHSSPGKTSMSALADDSQRSFRGSFLYPCSNVSLQQSGLPKSGLKPRSGQYWHWLTEKFSVKTQHACSNAKNMEQL